MLWAFFPPWCSAVERRAFQLNPVTIPKHSWLILTAAWPCIPTDKEDMPQFQNPLEHRVSSCKSSQSVYDRREEFELHNGQLPCPLIPSLFHSICGFSVGGFGCVQIKNSQTIPDKNCEGHGTHIAQTISPIVVCCLGIFNCLFRSSVPQENPPSEKRKRGLVGCA